MSILKWKKKENCSCNTNIMLCLVLFYILHFFIKDAFIYIYIYFFFLSFFTRSNKKIKKITFTFFLTKQHKNHLTFSSLLSLHFPNQTKLLITSSSVYWETMRRLRACKHGVCDKWQFAWSWRWRIKENNQPITCSYHMELEGKSREVLSRAVNCGSNAAI